jgi:hypothetical protein
MEKIDLLLEQLDNKIPQSLAKKIDKLDDLNEKLELAENEYQSDPSEENKESLDEINDYIETFELEIIQQLQSIVNNKKQSDAKSKEVKTPTPIPAKQQTNEQKPNTEQVITEEKKESSGVLGIVIGAVLLVGSLGAINYFKNNR